MADKLWIKFQMRGLRDFVVRWLKWSLEKISPDLVERFWSKTPLGEYLGEDRGLNKGEKKVPLHSVSLQGCAWMVPYHIGVCEGTSETFSVLHAPKESYSWQLT